MGLKIKTEPTAEPLSLFEVKDHLRLDHDEHSEDDLLQGYIGAACRFCESIQNRAYITQTWELWLDSWPSGDSIEIPKPPLQSATIKYYDTSDTEYTFSSSSYFVDTKDLYAPCVSLKYGQSWPSTTLRPHNGICVTFVAGYGDDGYDVPQDYRNAMLLYIGHLYANREASLVGVITEVPLGVRNLLMRDRVY